VVQTTTGSDILAQSDKLLNSIKYDITDYGIGNLPLSLASSKYADYFCDPINGVVVRASHNGNEAISVIYNCNSFFGNRLKAFNGPLLASTQNYPDYPNMPVPTIYGFIDKFTGNYIIAAEKIDRWQNGQQRLLQSAFTISFSDNENKFISFLSFESEAGGSIGNLLCTFKNGILYTHDGDNPCNYYGVQYAASITAIANQNFLNDKAYLAIRESASCVWYGEDVNTSLGQQSKIPAAAFRILEGNPCAPFYRDIKSAGGLANGVPLKGKWLSIKLTITPSAIQTISVVVVKYNAYPH